MGTEAIIVRPDAGVKTIADLKGKKLLTTANAGVNTFFPLVLKNAGLDGGRHQLTNVPEGALVSSYLQGAGGAVGMLGGLDDKPAEIKANGGAAAGRLSLFGFRGEPGRLLHRHRHARHGRESNPDLVKRFVQATVKSYKEAEANPEAAVAAMADIVGGTMDEERQGAGARGARGDARRPLFQGNKDKKLGLQRRRQDWDDMLDAHEEVQRPADRQAGVRLLHQRLPSLMRCRRSGGAGLRPRSPADGS